MTSLLRSAGRLQQPMLGIAESLMAPWRGQPKPVVLPTGFKPIPPTPKDQLEGILMALQANAADWAATTPAERARLLRECIRTTVEVCEEAATAATNAKGSYGNGIAEELLGWVPVVQSLREYSEALEAGGAPKVPGVRRRADGQAIVDVFPLGLESVLYGGFKGELWVQPGAEPTQGQLYRDKKAGKASEKGGVGLVLGAGNQLPVAALDILHKLVVDDEVVICKMNPVNEYLGPYIRRAFAPLVDAGCMEIVYGGGDVGAMLCNHPIVASIHLTGSGATYDAIVWKGMKTEEEKKKLLEKHPLGLIGKPVGAELGCVTPYIIVPGPWSDSDLDYHAETVAAGMTHNSGHNCLAAELVITDANWPLREKFLAALRRRIAAQPNRVAYYTGSEQKVAAFQKKFPDAEVISNSDASGGENGGDANDSAVEDRLKKTTPWLLKTGLSPEQADASSENWCGVLQEVALPGGGDAADFMAAAAAYANDRCWGTLSCAVIVHPATKRAHVEAYEQMIASLKYGAIAVNCPTIMAFAITKLGWGGFPGTTPADIGSGNCFVHNTYLFDNVQKSVLYAPWRFHPYPFWAPSNRNGEAVTRRALHFMAGPTLVKAIPLALSALRG